MPTIKDKIRFNFDGKWSSDFGLVHVVLDSGMYEETLSANRSIVEGDVSGRNKPNFYRVNETPLEFEMNIAFEKKFTNEDIDKVIRWLYVDYYKPLYFEGEEGRVFYCMPVGNSLITHNGLKEGFITITMRCDSSNKYSPVFMSPTYNISDGESKSIDLYNDGHFTIYPEISIKKIGNGNITIVSVTDGGKIFEIRDLTNTEDIYINCEKEIIDTDIIGVNRYNNILGEYPKLTYGRNTFEIEGSCEIQFRYQLKYRF